MKHRKSNIIYADFESLLNPVSTAIQDPQTSYTVQTAHHTPSGYTYIMIGPDRATPVQVYQGENTVDHFLETIIHEKEKIAKKSNTIIPMQLTEAEEQVFQNATSVASVKQII